MTLILRNIKNDELTWNELDGNFLYLEDEIERVEQLTGSANVVRVTSQSFLSAEQDIARANIAAASVEVVDDLEERIELLETVEPVTYEVQTPTLVQQQTARENIGLNFNEFIYVITPTDALLTTTLDIQLPNTPNLILSYHVGVAFVNKNRYTVVNDIVTFLINPTFPLQAGKEITIQYFY